MNNININVFATNVKDCLDKVIDNHEPVKINIDNDRECIIISAEDWKNRSIASQRYREIFSSSRKWLE